MILKDRSVLVTGAGGFIGSHLVEELVTMGAHVRAFVHYNSRNDWGNLELLPSDVLQRLEVVAGDVQDAGSVRKAVAGCDVVFHLAALISIPYSYIAPESFVNTNVRGTLNVMQACLDEGVRKVVHTSTSEAYGTAIYTPIDEQHALQGQSPYSASKIGADKIAESYYRSFDVPVSIIRPFNTYGPRQSARAIIPTVLAQLLSGARQIKLGSLTPVRDLTYVDDMVQGFIKVAQVDESIGQVINVGFGRGISIGQLVETITRVAGSSAEIIEDPQRVRPDKSEVFELLCDNTRARTLLDWKPRISLEDGLKRVMDFIQANPSLYKPALYNV